MVGGMETVRVRALGFGIAVGRPKDPSRALYNFKFDRVIGKDQTLVGFRVHQRDTNQGCIGAIQKQRRSSSSVGRRAIESQHHCDARVGRIRLPNCSCQFDPFRGLGNGEEASRFPRNVLPLSIGSLVSIYHGNEYFLSKGCWLFALVPLDKQLDHSGIGINVDRSRCVSPGLIPVIGRFPALNNVNFHQFLGFKGFPIDNGCFRKCQTRRI
mmetsp:Transcript_7149/g.17469  ORF Transcript_7149/g.17469 Transcript_7149/m.17469 type:complete len:212 (-) Transcript_7149:839-1474(-)